MTKLSRNSKRECLVDLCPQSSNSPNINIGTVDILICKSNGAYVSVHCGIYSGVVL